MGLLSRFIAIDPGVSGAIAILEDDAPPRFYDLPIIRRNLTKRTHTRLDGAALLEILRKETEVLYQYRLCAIGVEVLHAFPVNGKLSIFSMGHSMGVIESVLDIMRRSHPKLIIMDLFPTEWKKFHGLKKATKEDSRQLALKLLRHDVHPDRLRRKCDHNRAEAALMALYMRSQTDERFVQNKKSK